VSALTDDATYSEREPHDPVTALANEILGEHELPDGVRAVVMVVDTTRGRSGLGARGYDPGDQYDVSTNIAADLFGHLQGVFEAAGSKLMIVPLGRDQ
jgi:hypothetical protein